MLYDHETRRQLSLDHRERLADDARRTRGSTRRGSIRSLFYRIHLLHARRVRERNAESLPALER